MGAGNRPGATVGLGSPGLGPDGPTSPGLPSAPTRPAGRDSRYPVAVSDTGTVRGWTGSDGTASHPGPIPAGTEPTVRPPKGWSHRVEGSQGITNKKSAIIASRSRRFLSSSVHEFMKRDISNIARMLLHTTHFFIFLTELNYFFFLMLELNYFFL